MTGRRHLGAGPAEERGVPRGRRRGGNQSQDVGGDAGAGSSAARRGGRQQSDGVRPRGPPRALRRREERETGSMESGSNVLDRLDAFSVEGIGRQEADVTSGTRWVELVKRAARSN